MNDKPHFKCHHPKHICDTYNETELIHNCEIYNCSYQILGNYLVIVGRENNRFAIPVGSCFVYQWSEGTLSFGWKWLNSLTLPNYFNLTEEKIQKYLLLT